MQRVLLHNMLFNLKKKHTRLSIYIILSYLLTLHLLTACFFNLFVPKIPFSGMLFWNIRKLSECCTACISICCVRDLVGPYAVFQPPLMFTDAFIIIGSLLQSWGNGTSLYSREVWAMGDHFLCIILHHIPCCSIRTFPSTGPLKEPYATPYLNQMGWCLAYMSLNDIPACLLLWSDDSNINIDSQFKY